MKEVSTTISVHSEACSMTTSAAFSDNAILNKYLKHFLIKNKKIARHFTYHCIFDLNVVLEIGIF